MTRKQAGIAGIALFVFLLALVIVLPPILSWFLVSVCLLYGVAELLKMTNEQKGALTTLVLFIFLSIVTYKSYPGISIAILIFGFGGAFLWFAWEPIRRIKGVREDQEET